MYCVYSDADGGSEFGLGAGIRDSFCVTKSNILCGLLVIKACLPFGDIFVSCFKVKNVVTTLQ